VSTFVLIPGAGGAAWYWHRVVPLLRGAGHAAIAVDLPGDDEHAGLPEYTRAVLTAVRAEADDGDGDGDVVIVGQSLGGFTAPLVAAQLPTRALVLVNAMIPAPGETPGEWWGATGWSEARMAAAESGGYAADFDPFVYFLSDVPPEVVAAGESHQRPEADAVFASVFDLAEWPAVGVHVVVGADDRFFPPAFQRALARERLGLDVDVLPGGHLIALARPRELANYLLRV
jgi:pimeloyl-ACP methyl ester carboxylesterase